MAKFIASPHTAAGAVTEQTPTAALHTVLQINVPAAVSMDILGWGISFKGTVSTDAPGQCYLMEGDVAASVGTSITPDPLDHPGFQPSLCIGGAALTGYGFTTENTIAATRILDTQEIHPQTGYSVWFPTDKVPRCGLIASARFVRVRISFAVAYACVPWVAWEE